MSRLVRCIRCEEWYYESAPSTLCHECHHKQSIMDAVEKLSPSTRDLLLRSPEAVEACVKAVMSLNPNRFTHTPEVDKAFDALGVNRDVWDLPKREESK